MTASMSLAPQFSRTGVGELSVIMFAGEGTETVLIHHFLVLPHVPFTGTDGIYIANVTIAAEREEP